MLVCAQSVTANLRSRQLAMAAIEREFLELEGTQGGWNALFQVERGAGGLQETVRVLSES